MMNVTSFYKREEMATDTIAHAGNFTSDTVRPENLFNDEIIIHTRPRSQIRFRDINLKTEVIRDEKKYNSIIIVFGKVA